MNGANMRLRKAVFWSHLVVGVAIAVVVAMLSVTGLLLTYEAQMLRLAEPRIDAVAAPMPAQDLAGIALVETGGKATGLMYRNDPGAAVAATFGRGDKLFLHPETGTVLGDNDTALSGFFSTVEHLHRWFALDGDNRAVGKAITGAANLGFLFLILSGLYLWWPKKWKWRIVRMNLWFRSGLPNAKARDFNWHHVFGFWAMLPLLAIVISGAVISYPWASDLVFRAYGEEPVTLRRPGGATGVAAPPSSGVGLQYVLDQARGVDADWTTITLSFPKGQGQPTANAEIDTGTGRQPARKTTLTYAMADGELVATKGQGNQTPARQARIFLRFLHTGEVFGVAGQTIAGLASLFTLVMVWTGLALSWRRLVRPMLRRASGVS